MTNLSQLCSLMLVLSLGLTLAADCPTNDHRITSLPYWKQADNLPCMFAGTIATTDKHNLFYWFFKNTALTNAPLVLWINGGPGSSSMFGLFLENGPIRVQRDADTEFSVGLSTVGSWGNIADIIYLD